MNAPVMVELEGETDPLQIALKELRIGLERDEKGWGIITRWQHVACSRLPSDVDASRIDGYEKLPADEQARIDEMLAAKGTPAHLRGVDIDEEMTQAAERCRPSHCSSRTGPSNVRLHARHAKSRRDSNCAAVAPSSFCP